MSLEELNKIKEIEKMLTEKDYFIKQINIHMILEIRTFGEDIYIDKIKERKK